jgi:hypothetical protein
MNIATIAADRSIKDIRRLRKLVRLVLLLQNTRLKRIAVFFLNKKIKKQGLKARIV